MENALRTGLREELEGIHFANRRYLTDRSHEADVEHQQRQERLNQLRKEYDSPENLNQEWAEY